MGRVQPRAEGPETTGTKEGANQDGTAHAPIVRRRVSAKPVGPGATGELNWRLPECWSRTEKSRARPP